MKSASVAVLVCVGVLAVGVSAQAQGQSPLYYGTQIGGGTIAALAGGVAGTLVGGLSGALLALPIEFARNPKGVYQVTQQERQTQTPEDLLAPPSEEPLSIQWAFKGAKIGFGLGASVGAAMGVIGIGKLFGVEGDLQGAFTGAFAGGLVGMILLTEPQKYPFSFQGWYCERTEKEPNKISWECGYKSASMEPIEVLLSPMALAALGATIGYNAKVGLAISAPLVDVRF